MNALDPLSILSCVVIMMFCFFSAVLLFVRAVCGDYVIISGECLSVTLTAIRKRTKMIALRTEDNHTIQVMVKQRLKKIRTGSTITLYVAVNLPVYEKRDAHLIHSYLAMEVG
jgi:hypothetical protein